MNKKGVWGWEEISKLLLVIIILLVLLGIIFYLKENGFELIEKINNIFRFR